MVCICTLEDDEGIILEEYQGWWRGWALYHLHHDQETASSAALSAALRRLAPLQSHAHTALTNATLLLAEVGCLSYIKKLFTPIFWWNIYLSLREFHGVPSYSNVSFCCYV